MEITSVILHTASLKEMRDFYIETLEFPLIKESEVSFRIAVGSSELEFTSESVRGTPYYHFAINIPSNKFHEAQSWAKEKVKLSTEDGDDEAHFSFMDAYAFYFNDPSGNIVEFIARSTSVEEKEPFSINQVINISEIGLTLEDAISVGNEMIANGIEERFNQPLSSTSLNFMGDKEKGIFIILNQPGRRWIFSDKLSTVYPLEITTSEHHRIRVDSNNHFKIEKNATNS
ncbi:VOC family protein [Ornithinibacillus californiensis]|uniref:VOC family protein n=1 Tax=Ornithinibacillus californiensis TaxID=161536 RepID=UPI00064D989C|nr:VOC family protein [Ornithinibacillus californiensis]